MIFSILIYNVLMAGVDAAALGYIRRKREVGACFLAALSASAAGTVLAVALGRNLFGLMHLAAYALFAHGAVLLLFAALMLWNVQRKTGLVFVAAAAAIVGIAVDAALIEPTWLEVSRVEVISPKIHTRLRIVVLSDLQTDEIGEYEKRVFRLALEEKPDVVLLAGDYLQSEGDRKVGLQRELAEFLHELDLPSTGQVFAIQGNVDSRDWAELFSGLPVTAVRGTQSFSIAGIQLTCLGLADSGMKSLEVASPDARRFHMVLGHRPDFALGEIEADLLVAGHTHGGQVRVPGIGPLVTLSAVPRSWAAGLTELPEGRKLLVSRGVGMERGHAPRLRFLCRPELVVLDLVTLTDAPKKGEDPVAR